MRRLATAVAAPVLALAAASAQQPLPAPEGVQTYTVFLQSRAIGQEIVTLQRTADGWAIRGSNRLAPPLDLVTRSAEILYDSAWRPTRVTLDTIARGQEVRVTTTFKDGEANSEIAPTGQEPAMRTDKVALDTIVLPNSFLTSYLALARRLVGQKPGQSLSGFIVPQGEVGIRVDGVFSERIETPRQIFAATRYALLVSNPEPAAEVPVNIWTDENGVMLRMSVPAQMLEVAREDIASAATRTTAFSVPGDTSVRIPAAGFGLAASVTRPASAGALRPAVILVGGSTFGDRDGFIAGIPVLGQLAAKLAEAGFIVVRYDRRGTGQSGGRSETTTITDYAEDVRAAVGWLDRQRKEVDRRRIAVVGHGDGGWIALTAAARDDRIAAVALIGTAASTGNALVLEQQQRLLDRLKTSDAQEKVDLQRKINAAALGTGSWDGVPEAARRAAETPWFQSYLAFDPTRVMRDVRQPVLIVHGALDTVVAPSHAEKLAELARARRRTATIDVQTVPGVNHLLVPAKTGEVEEYAMLPEKQVSSAAGAAIADWLTKTLATPR
jgi:pimeloyl-ACP methyl ester carboxylesterase